MKSFKQYIEETEATFKAQNEIIEEKLSLGINGLEWLVLNTETDSTSKGELERFINLSQSIYGKNHIKLFKDVVVMKPDDFYEKHELNWWILFDHTLTYLAILRQRNYEAYFHYLNDIYKSEKEGTCPRCKNSQVKSHYNFCTICGLKVENGGVRGGTS